ncbi:primosomal protein N' [Pelosinus propionicus]|uniref:Replication restart protein PriA n=1 Tax=Pelosinus propionicus DSM 13327 TaxID=1123291 RepID=A0A1I4L8R9_9FIRM|nr:primosomal protein N' [Pelosinus propionicus]SFL87269.1 replication restart DNA helicase PriA [Pelosinus propionicus DSM 13327]
MQRIAQVLINITTKNINKAFSYSIPEHLDYVDAGWRVLVPFGNRKLEGFVIAIIIEEDSSSIELKPIIDILDNDRWFDEHMMNTARWISEYYLCNLVDAMRLFIPGKSGVKSVVAYSIEMEVDTEKALVALSAKYPEYSQVLSYIEMHSPILSVKLEKKFGPSVLKAIRYLVRNKIIFAESIAKRMGTHRYKTVISLLMDAKTAREQISKLANRPAQCRLLQYLIDHGQLASDELKKSNTSHDTVKKLVQDGLIKLEKVQVLRDSYADICKAKNDISLTIEQQQALEKIMLKMKAKEFQSFLLHGITGSGKTQVYIEAVAAARQKNRQAIVLVPEIALTSQIVSRFKARFGNDVVVMHSKLSTGERYDAWQRLRSRQAGIVIGARSAIFAPASDLGIIIMDEEHEFTYKQEETPRYHTRQVAITRATLSGAVVIMGSATPAIETYFQTQMGQHTLLLMSKRIANANLPEVTIVDMREELRKKRRNVISLSLQELLQETISRGEQAIILLNRRGYATFVMCRECGHIARCKHCDISLVYHSVGKKLKCHYCQCIETVPDICPECNSRYIRFFGTGTQKLQEEIVTLFPHIRVVRMDQDTTGGRMAYDRILEAFAKGEYDLLLGTQMVAKGHDVKNVTAVGIIAADSILNLPDFRAAERVYALLTQAAGRAGRGDKAGKVVVQTYNPEHYAVQAGANQDYQSFYEAEIVYRKALCYPPYGQIIKLTVQAKEESMARSQADQIIKELRSLMAESKTVEIIGPFPAPIAKVNDIFRMNMIIKAKDLASVRTHITSMGLTIRPDVMIDVEPVSIM